MPPKQKDKEEKHICSFTEHCKEEVHDCPYVDCCNHCKEHCWHGDMD